VTLFYSESARHADWPTMSGVVNRGVDMDTSGPVSLGRRLANGRQSPTAPLKIFGHGKKKINDIFVEISSYIDDGNQFLEGTQYFGGDCVVFFHFYTLEDCLYGCQSALLLHFIKC